MKKNLLPGDYITFKLAGAVHSGLVLPSTTKETLFIKLENGYNIGIKWSDAKDVKKGRAKRVTTKAPTLKGKAKLPKIAIITTGGTITSRVDYKTGAVHALTKPEELLAQIPELSKLTSLQIISPFSIMSEDMTHKHWQKLAEVIHKKLQSKSIRGVILTMGTDTLHWTSMALSFMLGKISKPVAVVGGQRSSDRGSFDGAQNLICATHYCLSDLNEVAVVMHGSSDDKYCIAIPGTKVRKMHTSRRDAFRPINTMPLAKIWPDGKIKMLKHSKIQCAATKFNPKFYSKIALVKFVAGVGPEAMDSHLSKGCKGIIIEGEGLGHVPVQSKHSWLPSIKKAIKKGVFVGMTSQCLYGRVNPNVYTNLRLISEAGVTFLDDMLPEAAYVKLGCVLARTKSRAEATRLMKQNWVGEISERIEKGTFLY